MLLRWRRHFCVSSIVLWRCWWCRLEKAAFRFRCHSTWMTYADYSITAISKDEELVSIRTGLDLLQIGWTQYKNIWKLDSKDGRITMGLSIRTIIRMWIRTSGFIIQFSLLKSGFSYQTLFVLTHSWILCKIITLFAVTLNYNFYVMIQIRPTKLK